MAAEDSSEVGEGRDDSLSWACVSEGGCAKGCAFEGETRAEPPPSPPPWEKEKREARREEWRETRAHDNDRRARCQRCLGGVEEVPCRGCG